MNSLSPSPSLADLQLWMRWIFTNPLGPYVALKADPGSPSQPPDPSIPHEEVVERLPFVRESLPLGRFQEPSPRRLDMISENPPIDRLQRLSIYADAYFVRLLECLASDFRTLRGVLGPQRFQRLVADYLSSYPSTSPHVGDVGHALPRFLTRYPLSEEVPFIPDLALLEWNILKSLYSRRLPALVTSRLASIPESAWPDAKIVLDPTVRLIGTEWAVDLLWEDRFLPEPAGRRTLLRKNHRWLVVYRGDEWVRVESIDGPQWFALERFQEGAALEKVCRDLEELIPDASALPVMEWFRSWAQAGILKGVVI